MTDEERQEIRAAVRQELSLLLSQMLVGLLTPEQPKTAAPGPAPDAPTVEALLGMIADAPAGALAVIEQAEREGPNRPEVFAALGARMEALRGAAG